MGTFAISYRPNKSNPQSSEIPELIVHFNHWQLAKGASGLQFVDLGFNIRNADVIGQVRLILPFAVETDDIIDLSYTLQDIENLKSVFNRNLMINHDGSGGLSAISHAQEPTNWHFNFLLLTVEPSQVALSSRDGHSIYLLTLTAAQLAQISSHPTKCLYMRLRILGSSISNLTAISKPSFSKPFLTSFYEEQMIEVNFNRARNLPRSVVDPADLPFKIASLNYFLIKDSKYGYKSSSRPYDNLRRLEQRIWNDYITLPADKIRRSADYYEKVKHSVERFNKSEAGMAKEQLLAYQWDFDSVGNDFNVFAWFQREFINLKYFVVGLILISLFFELSGNYLYDWLTKEPAHKVERPVALQNACQEEN